MQFRIKNLHRRNDRWAYRKVVPRDLRTLVGKTEWTHSLENSDSRVATQTAIQLNDDYQDLIIKLRSGALKQVPGPLSCHQSRQRLQSQSIHNLSRVYEHYTVVHFGGIENKPSRASLESFTNFLGDKDIRAIRREDVKRWIKTSREQNNHSEATIKRRITPLTAMVQFYLRDRELDGIRNPFSGHRINPLHSVESKLPFHRTHLDLIENSIQNSNSTPATKAQVILMKYTGAGPKEIGGLRQVDVNLDADIPYIWIRPNELRRLKTAARERKLPLMDHAVEAMQIFKRDNGNECIWGRYPEPNALSAKLNKFIRAAGVPKSPRLTAYSFRHTLEAALVDSGASTIIQKSILGHARTDMTEKYGASRMKLTALHEAIGNAMGFLGDISEDNYREGELF